MHNQRANNKTSGILNLKTLLSSLKKRKQATIFNLIIYWQFGVHRLEELGLVGKQNLKGTGVHFLTFLKTFWV